jgi:hypothetical protein
LVSGLPQDPEPQDLQSQNPEIPREENTDEVESKSTTSNSLIPEEFDNRLDGKKYATENQEPDIPFEVISKIDPNDYTEEY